MLRFTGSLKIFVALEPCDMSKGFEGLTGLVAEKLKEDLRNGALKGRRYTPQIAMGKAINYTLTLWLMLQIYLEDGRLEIDNNLYRSPKRMS